MSNMVISQVPRTVRFKKPSDTAYNTIYTVDSAPRVHLEDISISAGGTGASYSIAINDGTTDWVIADAVALAANEVAGSDFGQPVLLDGWSLKVKSSVSNALTFMATFAEHYRQTTGTKL